MPAQWTGKIVGQMHTNSISRKMLAAELGWNEKYLSTVLNSENPPEKSESKISTALNRLIGSREVS